MYPSERDPKTGGRQLEELAFEVLATERLAHAGEKAAKLIQRGVRRVFAIDVVRSRAFEWSRELGTWSLLAPETRIDDPGLAVPLPVAALVDAARVDDATVQAYRTKRHPEFLAEREEGRRDATSAAVLTVLAGRGMNVRDEQRERIVAERDRARLDRWLRGVATCTSVAELLEL